MITPGRPTAEAIERHRLDRVDAEPTYDLADPPQQGFRHATYERDLGGAPGTFERAVEGIRAWAAHRGSGVEVVPADAPVAEGETIAIVTRQLGLCVLAACRVTEVVDQPDRFGFTYLTLPGHPERGAESFTVVRAPDGKVSFVIDVTYQAADPLVRLSGPIARTLQRRATVAYLDAMQRFVRGA